MENNDKKIAIVGGGVTGLSAGIHALLNGYSAEIYESHSIVGGNLTAWKRKDCVIDNCIHWLTGTNPNSSEYSEWKEIGAFDDMTFHSPESLFTFCRGDKKLSLKRNSDEFFSDMLTISPDDEKQIESLKKGVEAAKRIFGIAGEERNVRSRGINRLADYLKFGSYHFISIGQLSEKFKNPFLKNFLRGFIGKSFSALALVSVYATFTGGNGDIPTKGSASLCRALKNKYISLGGKIYTGKKVVKAEENENKVTLRFCGGEKTTCDFVVITADPLSVYEKIIPSKMPKSLKKTYDKRLIGRFSAIHVAIKLNGDTPFKGDLIFEADEGLRKEFGCFNVMFREFSHEKTFAPTGKSVVIAECFIPVDKAKNFIALRENRRLYEIFKNHFCDLIKSFYESRISRIDGEIIDCWTSATYNSFTQSVNGEFMSYILPPRFIPPKIPMTPRGFQRIIIASQGLKPIGGLPIALKSGKQAIEKIRKNDRVKTAFGVPYKVDTAKT